MLSTGVVFGDNIHADTPQCRFPLTHMQQDAKTPVLGGPVLTQM